MAPGERREPNTDADPRVGLCSTCQHAETVVSSRQNVFWRCALADTDTTFAKYPALPVVRCPGYAVNAS